MVFALVEKTVLKKIARNLFTIEILVSSYARLKLFSRIETKRRDSDQNCARTNLHDVWCHGMSFVTNVTTIKHLP